MRVIKTIARFKARQSRGSAWVSLILNMGIITANIALFKDFFEGFGLTLIQMILIGVFSYLFGTIVIGYLDEQYGVWKQENEFNTSLNPFMVNINEKLDEMIKLQDEHNREG